jgi:hypothetical protein
MTAEPRGPIDADIPPGIVARRRIGGFVSQQGARVLLIAAVLVFAFHFMPQVTLSLTDTETVILPLFYQDVVTEHHPLSDWYWPGARSLVPDDALFFLLRFASGNDWFAMEGVTVFLFLALVAAGAGLVWASRRPHALGLVTLLVLIVVAQACDFTPGSVGDLAFRKPLFQTVYHGGTASFCLAGFALLLARIQGAGRAAVGALLGIVFLAVVSDFLFIVVFSIPAVLAAGGLAIAFRREWKRHGGLALGVGLATAAGVLLAPWLFPVQADTNQHLAVDLNGMHNSLAALRGEILNPDRHYFVFLVALDVVTVLAALGGLIAFCFFPGGRRMPAPVLAAMIFCGSLISCDWGATLLTGGYADVSENRYILIALLLPLFVLAFGLHAVVQWRPWLENGVAAAAAVFIGTCAFIPQAPSPEYLGDLDLIPVLKDVMKKNQITAGLITYWRANLFTFLSHGEVPLRSETADGSVVRLHDTLRWYGKGIPLGEGPRFRLVFPEYDTLRQAFGPPDQVLNLPGGDTVWIYSEARAITYNEYFDLLSNRWSDHGRTMSFKGSDLSGAVGRIAGDARIAAPGDGDDFLATGPNLPLQPGHYRAVYRYQYLAAPDPGHPATYDLCAHRPAGDVVTHQMPLVYLNDQPQVFVDDFRVTEGGFAHEMRISYHDSGQLRVDSLAVTSLGP